MESGAGARKTLRNEIHKKFLYAKKPKKKTREDYREFVESITIFRVFFRQHIDSHLARWTFKYIH